MPAMRLDLAAVKPGLATSCLVQKNVHRPTAPPMATKMGYTWMRARASSVSRSVRDMRASVLSFERSIADSLF